MDNKNRYKRQIVLPEIGNNGQEKISNASVLVVGAGGLGSPALLYLSAAGVGHIGIIDFDNVDETNLQRQILFDVNDVGENKAKAAKRRLEALNPNINIEAIEEELNDKNVEELFNRFDIVIDGTDNFAAKFLINDAAVKTETPFIYGSILGFDGQVAVFNASSDNAPCYRCLFPAKPTGHIPNCAQNGVIGAVAGIIGTTQAMEAIKLIVMHESFVPLISKVWVIDVHTMETKLLSLKKDLYCSICSKDKDSIMFEYTSPSCNIIPEISLAQVKEEIENGNAMLLDVREKHEWDLGYIEGAQHVPLSWLVKGNVPDIPKDKNIIVYCLVGIRSEQAGQLLKAAGFENVVNMKAGYEEWLKYNSELR